MRTPCEEFAEQSKQRSQPAVEPAVEDPKQLQQELGKTIESVQSSEREHVTELLKERAY